ncbi:MAG: crossover junction endodeoxyribonuclease RuvC [Gammaproteobacteria bacterium RIFCSPLOWO2_02_47_7]|jgi:crossover junction endodeoxyribonuclease RuvC|nr:MAG: crossover junction endodeoxyribonuclease RuvC [Gammaproteobacteria bacterium RIFCSPLOWO2_02_47_7]OGT65475.1 MAG: crossover junction endodeoxyribonuclease RuvC [Gammaproteobacteria bacterium RIFCSPLOWO2_01_FULL_47_190]OGT76886.1 MAG: crossover junction endodeoxyribonuclease RuvC [Gammaproteobacteria bacterium RIFCSPLOWO2_12_47_11]OGT85267.1 MAG: crossover junction endodeoxyribonuclease RuvC [Gammaproteobacteria bacterium RIFCSPLOWO2_12_FULL_47_76]
MTRILGIDPGSRITGYGIIDIKGNHAIHITHGCIHIDAEELPDKLLTIFGRISDVVTQYHPEEMAIERVFMHRNADSALKLGQARGAAITACATQGLKIFEYTANQVKQATVGKGHAAKEQVQHMVKVLLCLEQIPQQDAADALGVALCHGHSRQGLMRMREVSGISGGRLR